MSVESLLTPLPLLLSAHAGADASRHRAIWAFDAQLAKVARTTRERAIGQMRLAWWNDVIDDPAGDHDWGIHATVELAQSAERGEAVVRVEGLKRL